MVREGAFDRYLLPPLNPLVQLLTTRTMRVGGLGDLLTGLGILIAAATIADVRWTPGTIGLAALAILGGAALLPPVIGLVTFAAAYRFWTVQLKHYQSTGN